MSFSFRSLFSLCCCGLAVSASGAADLADGPPEVLSPFTVSAQPSAADKYQLPQVTESVTATKVQETVNAVDTEDAVKYLPSIFLRKRNYGDTQAVMASRVWGVSSSARSLIYADGVLLTALVANNNTLGGPRWGLVAPAEIERIDLMYGPFAAAYPGNSMGAVMEITTRMPEKRTASLTQTEAWQHFSLYGTKDDYLTHQTAVTYGDRAGKFSFWVSGNYQDSHSQPLSFVTSAAFPAGTTGGYAATNKLNAPANVVGAGGLLHTRMTNGKFKAAYDFAPWLRMTYTFGLWRNDADSSAQTYLTNSAGQPTFAGLAGFASGTYQLYARHTAHSIAASTDTKGHWDFEAIATRYRFDEDRQTGPTTASATAAASPGFGPAGRVAVLDGTGWLTLDLKGTWRPAGKTGDHTVSFGAHDDQYRLFNPTYNTADWRAGGPYTGVATEGDGKTRTQALWLQDLWQVAPAVKVTLGLRYEDWLAYDGYNQNGVTVINQPRVSASNWSPKGSVAWTLAPKWIATASVGRAYRYATASELYQLVSTGTTFTSPNPNLKPDDVLATELRLERTLEQGRVRLSLFQDDIHDAIIAQFNPLVAGSTQLYSYNSNVDHVRARGVELLVERRNVWFRGLEFSGSVTYLDARTLALSGQASATAAPGSAIGKRLPNIPEWRAAFQVSYRPDDRWTISVGGRYSSLLYTTLDNSDVNPNTYQGFSSWFVLDTRVHYRLASRWSAALGIDNLLNREYFLFHPFPQRTAVAEVKYDF
ncbi:MAG: TonB-dependent receptor [Verrucomicrobia bacterium]|nr:TonB-dependent receptor [Verrucomicrobiota bacterium]